MMDENQIPSPVKEIPDCWQDDKQMNVLFSPFRKRELNPVGYDSKMKFWNTVIVQWCMENNQSLLTLPTLRTAFKRKGRTPSCLMTVIEELLRAGDLKNKSDFLNMTVPQTTWTSWVMNSVKTPFMWSMSKLKEALTEIDINEVQYVYMGYLKSKGESILSKAEEQPEKFLYTLEEMRKLSDPPCTTETAELLLHWLKLEGKACSVRCDEQELIKLSMSSSPLEITDRDIAQYKLVQSKEALLKAIAVLEEEKLKALNDAKEHLSKGLRIAAKSSLRKKKALEECITKRISTLDNLDLLFTRIRDAQSDAEVYNSYKVGVSALKATFKEAGLTEDRVINTITEIEEVNEMHDEIQNALSHQMQPNTESELEEELSTILSSFKLEDKLNLPEVPSMDLPELKQNKDKLSEPVKFAFTE